MRSLKCPKWVVLGACAALGLISSTVSAAILNGTKLTPPFPADIADPAASDKTLVNLTTMGSLDWIQVGQVEGQANTVAANGFIQKVTGTTISGYTQTGFAAAAFNGGKHFVTFADGSGPTVAATPQSYEIRTSGLNNGFSFNVAASNILTHELNFFAAALGGATGTFKAQLLNSSNQLISLFSADVTAANGITPVVYRVDFQGDNAGDHLAVSFLQTGGNSTADNLSFTAATVGVPEPASLALLLGSTGALLGRRRR